VVLPVWRRHRLARTDWSLDEQAYALQALMAGFLATATRTSVPGSVSIEAPEKVMAAAVTALLGPEEPLPSTSARLPRRASGCSGRSAGPCSARSRPATRSWKQRLCVGCWRDTADRCRGFGECCQ
jgi:hypothetical protein